MTSVVFIGDFQGINGFLGTRGSLMLDVVVLAMLAVIPVLAWSVNLAKRGQYALHKKVQVALATVLLLAIVAFEADLRIFTDWRQRAAPSPYYSADQWSAVWLSLIVHLAFAIPTFVLWVLVVVGALRGFPQPPAPSAHSGRHRKLGKLAGIGMFGTAVTGWVFYYLSFVAA